MNLFSVIAEAIGLKANQSQFAFRIAGAAEPGLTVTAFSGSGHGLSADYLFQVNLCGRSALAPGELVGKTATLELGGGETPVCIHGLISDFTWAGMGANGPEFVASLASPLFPLKLRRHNRIFLNTTVPQIIEELLQGAKLSCDFTWELQADYPVREYTVQYHESDWEFFSRLAAANGLFFRWQSDKEATRLLFHDGLELLPELPGGELLYQVHSGTHRERETIFAFNSRARLLTATTELRDYNYRTPEILLDAPAASTSPVPGHGSSYRYGDHHKDLPQGQQLARLRQQALDWQRQIYLADSDYRAATPGGRISLSGHPDAQLNGEYLILQVEHFGDQSAALSYGGKQTAMTYRNQLTLIPFGTPFVPLLPEQRPVHGVLTAKVESSGGQYAYLDEQGRYRVRLNFDDGQATPGEASHAVRLNQGYSGENYGLHLPLHPGTEVALACVNGDLDRPILLGVLPNPATPSPVNSGNHSQNILRTFGGNELLLEDRKGEERIELFTRERKNLVSLDAKAGNHKVRLATAEGVMEAQAAKSIHLESGDTHSTISGNDHLITVEHSQQLATKKAGIDLQAATDIRMKAVDNLDLHAEQQDLRIKAGNNLVLQAGEGMTVEVRNQNLTLRVTGGQLSVEAARELNILGKGGGAITIGQSGGMVTIAQNGAVTIASHTVNINGKSVNVQGASNKQGGGGRLGGWNPITGGVIFGNETICSFAGKIPLTNGSAISKSQVPTPPLGASITNSPGGELQKTQIRKIRVKEISGPSEGKPGETLIYKVTRFNIPDPTPAEKKTVNWIVKCEEEIIDKFEALGDTLKYEHKNDKKISSIKVYAYINAPSEEIRQTTFFDRQIIFGKVVSPEFKKKVIKISDNLDIDVNYLMAAMAFETGESFSPKKINMDSKAFGLIQFTKIAIEDLSKNTGHVTKEMLFNMSDVEQLDYVEKYFKLWQKRKGKISNLEDVYMAILCPNAIGKPNDFNIYSKKDGKSYTQNSALDGSVDNRVDGAITKEEASHLVRKMYEKGKKLRG